jgi:predicted nucleic acid-binding Zn ribbon protein
MPDLPTRSQQSRQAAAEALQEAKADALSRGDMPERGGLAGSRNAASSSGKRRPRRDDPQLFSHTIGRLLDQNGWQQQAAMGSVFGRWAEIVGADLAAHTKPDSFADGELAVVADSTAWATQVRLLAPVLVKRLNEEVGDGSVRRVKVRGPQPPRQRGGWRVPGSKGPGDTYG